jgi:hypothetical protein
MEMVQDVGIVEPGFFEGIGQDGETGSVKRPGGQA